MKEARQNNMKETVKQGADMYSPEPPVTLNSQRRKSNPQPATINEQPSTSNHKPSIKSCSRCNKPFDCNAADIQNCHCYTVAVPAEAAAMIRNAYSDCLCNACLTEIAQKEMPVKQQPEL